MASAVPIMPFLRPLAPPSKQTLQKFLRFSTRARCCDLAREDASSSSQRPWIPTREDPNLVASRTADTAYPPSSMRSMPRPKNPHASRRASLPPKERSYPTRGDTHHPKARVPLIPGAVKSLEPSLCAPNLAYFVNRTKSNELPIYNERKREGGTQLRTVVRRVDGNVELLRDELRESLGLNAGEVVVNPVNKHIHIKGHHKSAVQHYLWERRF